MTKRKKRAAINLTRLPREYIDWLSRPIYRFIHIESAAGIVLFISTLLAVLLANSHLSEEFARFWQISLGMTVGDLVFERSLHKWVNDAGMTLFFFLIALELKRELALGELRNPQLALLSIAAALGGMSIPPLFYLLLQYGESGQHGWGTVMATDTAFVIGYLALLGRSIPSSLRIFMLSMVVVDDIGAIFVVAIGYGEAVDWQVLSYALLGFMLVRAMAFLGVRSLVLFSIVGGAIWLVIDMSGVHPTITGVILGLLTPTNKWMSRQHLFIIMEALVPSSPSQQWSGDKREGEILKTAAAAARETLSPVERLEMLLHPWVGFVVLPLFALANAGVSLTSVNLTSPITLAVFVGFVFGKPIGTVLFSWIAVWLGIAKLPENLNWGMVFGGGMLAGIGFTMALFIAELAYNPDQINAAKLGIFIASITSALIGFLCLRYFAAREKQKGT
ncbi:Na+/H+ antiporter NhaA [Vibrio vulnificus]|uniref:Na+/H+ antiporter NhaA n=1 Tax=Vibrio vulnificus TaxID=672 RepID=UPI00102B1AC7|nr:Na+/H+ antiporter NhaA [Vibrio vulnificus]EGQ7929886.1 Na+/H+ antiporter NhaA [Vibrio vulnificus]EGQ9283806.1 Na+/H+ antiporter NhaA [Vibrio vulnificus]RZR45161.1 Na+/H+ antiporter NhaA [Vibrio vulnificus]HAS8427690.1 Na+/H+ antiporter NhaA [Vibrio vulnificus]